MMSTTDVLVVGAGPTGLLLAGDLARRGVHCTLVERRRDESNLTRAFAVHARTMEELDMRGVADDLARTGAHVTTLRVVGNVTFDLSELPTRYPYVLVTPQYETERLLEKRALDLGTRMRRGTEVVDLRQDEDGVDVDLHTTDGSVETVRATYVVGCDGLHSTVRHALDLPFPGETAIESVILADVQLADPPTDSITLHGTSDGFAFLVPFGDGYHRVITWDRHHQLPDDAPAELDEVRDILQRVHGTDYGIQQARWLSRFHSDERQAPKYRVGRVFLAGDAAHVHSPAGGQGMNAGLLDAANLSWRLVLAVRGHASTDLLDGYQDERHPVGRAILRGSGALLRLMMAQSLPTRAARRMLSVLGRFAYTPARVAEVVSAIGLAYPRPSHAHRLVGRRAEDVPVRSTHGERLYEALRAGTFVLTVPPGMEPPVPRPASTSVSASATDPPRGLDSASSTEPPQALNSTSSTDPPQALDSTSSTDSPQGLNSTSSTEPPQALDSTSSTEPPQALDSTSSTDSPQGLDPGRAADETPHPGRGASFGGWDDEVDVVIASGVLRLVRPDGYVAWAGEDTEAATHELERWFGKH